MYTKNIAISDRSKYSKFTLMKNTTTSNQMKFFLQLKVSQNQSQRNPSKPKADHSSKKQLTITTKNDIKTSLNLINDISIVPNMNNSKLTHVFKQLDQVKINMSSINRTISAYDKPPLFNDKSQHVKTKGNQCKYSNVNKLKIFNMKKDMIMKSIILPKDSNHSHRMMLNDIQNGYKKPKVSIKPMNQTYMINNKKLPTYNQNKSKNKGLYSNYPLFNQFLMMKDKTRDSKTNRGKKNDKELYLSTNQSHINKTVEDPTIKNNIVINTNKDIKFYYNLNQKNNKTTDNYLIENQKNYESKRQRNYPKDFDDDDSNDFSIQNQLSDEEQDNSGVLDYDDVKDIIIYHKFHDIVKERDQLFTTISYDTFLTERKDSIINKFFSKSSTKHQELKSPSTNDSR